MTPPARPLRSLLLTTSALALAACSGEPPPPPPAPVATIKYHQVGGEGSSSLREFPGEIQAVQTAPLSFGVSGRIQRLPVTEGQAVSAGEVLAQLDTSTYRALLDSAIAAEQNARVRNERIQQLLTEGVVSRQDADDAQAQADEALANLAARQKDLDDATIVAPFDGQVSRVMADEAEQVSSFQTIIEVVDVSSMEVVVAVAESVVARSRNRDLSEEFIRRIDPRMVASGVTMEPVPLRLKEAAQSADPTTRTFSVTFSFDPPADANLRPGMSARVTVRRGAAEEAPLLIPALALTSTPEGEAYVWVIERDAVLRRDVEVGRLMGEEVEIIRGLEDGDLIAASGVRQLREGMAVRRWEG